MAVGRSWQSKAPHHSAWQMVSLEVYPLLVVGFPTGPLRANCYVIAAGRTRDCVVIDPGQDFEGALSEALSTHGLKPVNILLTHGHYDHSAYALTLARQHQIQVGVHPGDRELLSQREVDIDEIRELREGTFNQADLRVTVVPTPGHTKGSVIFLFDNTEGAKLALTGDTLFAGSIGRTDFSGGDAEQLEHSLRQQVLSLPQETVVLPGHGSATTIGFECRNNPFLRSLATESRSTPQVAG